MSCASEDGLRKHCILGKSGGSADEESAVLQSLVDKAPAVTEAEAEAPGGRRAEEGI